MELGNLSQTYPSMLGVGGFVLSRDSPGDCGQVTSHPSFFLTPNPPIALCQAPAGTALRNEVGLFSSQPCLCSLLVSFGPAATLPSHGCFSTSMSTAHPISEPQFSVQIREAAIEDYTCSRSQMPCTGPLHVPSLIYGHLSWALQNPCRW